MSENCKEGDCPMLPRIKALENEAAHNKDAHKTFYERLENSHLDFVLLNERTQQIKEDTEEIKEAVQEMKDKPAKRWDGIVEKAIWAVIAAVIAYMLARVGLS